MSEIIIPTAESMMWCVIEGLRELGGSASIAEIDMSAINLAGYSELQQSVMHKESSSETEILYRLKWARTKLKMCGLVTSPARGTWTLTTSGFAISNETEVLNLYKAATKKSSSQQPDGVIETAIETIEIDAEIEWRDALIAKLRNLTPSAFEHVTKRLLIEIGFKDVRVTGKSGDQGIDGVASLQVLLLSFPVYFQCKRYEGSVSASEVRDFRGAMAGRGEKGLLVTTGAFTSGATLEANRDGAPPVQLVAGDRLAELMKEYRLGVKVITREVEDVTIDETFFDAFV
jgi:restriction system protein